MKDSNTREKSITWVADVPYAFTNYTVEVLMRSRSSNLSQWSPRPDLLEMVETKALGNYWRCIIDVTGF